MPKTAVKTKLARARTNLLLNHPWFGSQLLHLNLKPGERNGTDGTTLWYNSEWIRDASMENVRLMLAHEVLHCALGHPYRRGGRDAKQWNVAGDHAVNLVLQSSGFYIPRELGLLCDSRFTGWTADRIYAKLQEEQQQQQAQGGSGKEQSQTGQKNQREQSRQDDQDESPSAEGPNPQPQGQNDAYGDAQGGQDQNQDGTPFTGDVRDASTNQKEQNTEADWQIIGEQAKSVAQKAGKLPSAVQSALDKVRSAPQVDWVAVLREYLQRLSPSNYSYRVPNRRLPHIRLPGVLRDQLGTVALAIDTSGSISQALYHQFRTEVEAVLREANPQSIVFLECDAAVQHVEEMQPGDVLPNKRHGRGGTRFTPVFEQLENDGTDPVLLIYLTDGVCYDAPDEPGYPVLWLLPPYFTADNLTFGVKLNLRNGENQ